jgi:hypothetical protein
MNGVDYHEPETTQTRNILHEHRHTHVIITLSLKVYSFWEVVACGVEVDQYTVCNINQALA